MDNNTNTDGIFSGTQQPQADSSQIESSQMKESIDVSNQNSHKEEPSIIKKIFGGIILSFIILGLFIGVQYISMFIFLIIYVVKYIARTGAIDDVNMIKIELMRLISQPDFMTSMTAILTAISTLVAVPCYWGIWGRKKTVEDKKYFKEKVLKVKPFVMISIAAVGFYYFALILIAIIQIINPQMMANYTEMMDMALGGNVIFSMLAAVILAPINEECIMRGLILKNLQKYFSDPAVIIIQAVMFGIFHMNWVQGIYAFPIGAALGFVAIKSRSILPSIYMHLFYNLLSFVVGLLPVIFQTGFFAVIAVVACAGIVWNMSKESKSKV